MRFSLRFGCCLLLMFVSLVGSAIAAPTVPVDAWGDEVRAALKDLLAETKVILAKDNTHFVFDRPRLLKEFGLTWRPEFLVPNDLASKLSRVNTSCYAGMKMFDAVYAAAFSKSQEVADALKAIEECIQALDLRSQADFDGRMIKTVKKAILDPDKVDMKALLEELSADLEGQLPAFLTTPITANHLLGAVYGATLQLQTVMSDYFASAQPDQIKALRDKGLLGFSPENRKPCWMTTVIAAFEAFARHGVAMDDAVAGCGGLPRVSILKDIRELKQAELDGKLSPDHASAWAKRCNRRVAAQRAAILANGEVLDTSSMSAEEAKATLENLASETYRILDKERLHTMFDWTRRLKEQGLVWRPELILPNDLTSKLQPWAVARYCGAKMFDAVYASVFNKTQEAADAIKVVEECMQVADLRSHADFDGRMIKTVKKAVLEPETVNMKSLLEQLTIDLEGQLPTFMSSGVTAEFLLDALEGFTIQSMFITLQYAIAVPAEQRKQAGASTQEIVPWMNMVIEAHYSFAGHGGLPGLVEHSNKGKSLPKMVFFQDIRDFFQGLFAGTLTPEQEKAKGEKLVRRAAKLQAAILELK